MKMTHFAAAAWFLGMVLAGWTADFDPRSPNALTFEPVEARYIRMVIAASNSGTQPCVDELEVYGPTGGTNLALAWFMETAWPAPSTVVGALLVGWLAYGVSLSLFVVGLRHLGTARTGAYFSVAPFFGTALAIPLLGEPVDGRLLVAGTLMALGVWLHLTERHGHEHTHAALEHEHAHAHDDGHHRHGHDEPVPPGKVHTHRHRHEPLTHDHDHFPDAHHRHRH